MNDTMKMMLVLAVVGILTQVANYIKAAASAKLAGEAARLAGEAKTLGTENKETLEKVGKQFDGRLSQLMEKAEIAQRALGITEGQDKEREIQNAKLDHAAIEARKVVADALVEAIRKLQEEKEHVTSDPSSIKSVALDAVQTAVQHEIARTPVVVAEVRRADEIEAPDHA